MTRSIILGRAFVLITAAYLAFLLFTPFASTAHPVATAALWITGGLIVVNFAISMASLLAERRILFSVAILNVLQLVLFGCVHAQIFDTVGHEHYSYAAPPRWFDWAGLIGIHALRAIDVIDMFEAYDIKLLALKHATSLSGTVLLAMHLTVDLFFLGALGLFVSKLRARWIGKDGGHRLFLGVEIFKVLSLRRNMPSLVILLSCIVFAVAVQNGWSPKDWLLWPLENALRTLDFTDAFYLYDWRLNTVSSGEGYGSLSLAFRTIVAWYLIGSIGPRFYFLKTAEELVEIVGSHNSSVSQTLAASLELERIGQTDKMCQALADQDSDVKQAVNDAMFRRGMGLQEKKAYGCLSTIVCFFLSWVGGFSIGMVIAIGRDFQVSPLAFMMNTDFMLPVDFHFFTYTLVGLAAVGVMLLERKRCAGAPLFAAILVVIAIVLSRYEADEITSLEKIEAAFGRPEHKEPYKSGTLVAWKTSDCNIIAYCAQPKTFLSGTAVHSLIYQRTSRSNNNIIGGSAFTRAEVFEVLSELTRTAGWTWLPHSEDWALGQMRLEQLPSRQCAMVWLIDGQIELNTYSDAVRPHGDWPLSEFAR